MEPTLFDLSLYQEDKRTEIEIPIEGTRLTPSQLESIYSALERADIDPFSEEPRLLTPGEFAQARAEYPDIETAKRLCNSICNGIKLEKAFEIAIIMLLARDSASQWQGIRAISPAYDGRYATPEEWFINQIYPSIREEEKEVLMEAFLQAKPKVPERSPIPSSRHLRSSATKHRKAPFNDQLFCLKAGEEAFINQLIEIFTHWHSRHGIHSHKGQLEFDGTLIPYDEVLAIWNSPNLKVRRFPGDNFPLFYGDIALIMTLAHQILYYVVCETANISRALGRTRFLSDIALQPAVQTSIGNYFTKDGVLNGKRNTIFARTDFCIMRNGVPISLVDFKTGLQMSNERINSGIARVTVLSYILAYRFSKRGSNQEGGMMSLNSIDEEDVYNFLSRVASSIVKQPKEQNGVNLFSVDYLHLPSGKSVNMFPGIFTRHLSETGRSVTYENLYSLLVRTYRNMQNLFEFARLNKQYVRFWSNDHESFLIPKPIPKTMRSVVLQPRLMYG